MEEAKAEMADGQQTSGSTPSAMEGSAAALGRDHLSSSLLALLAACALGLWMSQPKSNVPWRVSAAQRRETSQPAAGFLLSHGIFAPAGRGHF